jgi:hypothetical protein
MLSPPSLLPLPAGPPFCAIHPFLILGLRPYYWARARRASAQEKRFTAPSPVYNGIFIFSRHLTKNRLRPPDAAPRKTNSVGSAPSSGRFFLHFLRPPNMMSTLKFITLCCAALIAAGAARAVETERLAANDPPHAQRRHAAASQEQARNDNAMQAVCREILVDTDEGYGVTSHESRVICDELR